MNLRLAVLTASAVAWPLFAQTAAEHIALGDRDHAALNAAGALRRYQEAIRLDATSAPQYHRRAEEALQALR